MLREFSAGGIIYKKEGNNLLWLIRRPKGGKGYRGNLGWSFPKGWLNKGETLEQAALREVAEEGGVKAKIIAKLPALKIFFTNPDGQKVKKSITYFVMEKLEDLKEGFGWETKEIKWVSKKGAFGLLAYKNEQELLKQAAKILTTT
jgi:ADP-ribose pyrophosphatase YjhB (NUDIX family)